ncbi:GldM family protein [Lewinella sp. W8]|uniref:type IX secretion system motor protein PorM/GldM n=1 Tax=Lewinella sp. W8 TaxID=2528208 RepID=UPI0010689CE3|nr:GldM family protein [Lewinella sp. W8]MTB49467.1 hypothetical protein [Lewinella sp. W8]
MSIPKEPRQLMINIMYLVLMALLALNVSAEVMNAFQTLDEGNQASINTVEEQLGSTVEGLEALLDDDSKAEFRPILPAIEAIQSETANFNSYVNQLRGTIIDAAGNNDGELNEEDYKEDHGVRTVRGKKNKDVTTRILVLGEDGVGGEPGEGEALKAKIVETRDRLIEIYTNLLNEYGEKPFGLKPDEIQERINSVANNMPFSVDDEAWKEADRESWSDYKFGHMPVAAVLPLMSQMQSDLKVSEANLINDMASLAGGRTVKFDAFFPVFEADRSYVIGGESLNAKVSVGSYSSSLDPANVDLRVNGQRLTVGADGKADFSTVARGQGPQTLNLSVAVTNPLTGEVTEGESKFTYEVGQRSVAVSADKMNVFYIGVDNPLTVSAAGVPSGDVRVRFGENITGRGSGSKYTVQGQRQGETTVTVTANGQTLGSFPFRVKRIPDPIPMLGNSKGGQIRSNVFKSQTGLYAFLDNFDFEAKCNIAGYDLVYVPKREDAVLSQNPGGNFNTKSKNLVNRAKPGDIFYAQNIRAKCPGDAATRPIGTMVFNIQ